MKVGDRVVVWANGHPQDGMRGTVTEFLGYVTAWGKPRALVKRDDGTGFNIVGIPWLIEEPESGKEFPPKPIFAKQ